MDFFTEVQFGVELATLANAAGNVTKKSDDATTPFLTTRLLDDDDVRLRENDTDWYEEGTTTMTSRAEPVAEVKGGDGGGSLEFIFSSAPTSKLPL